MANTGDRLALFFYGSLSKRRENIGKVFLEESHCIQCNQKIPVIHLLPVLSWFILRGKCQKCKNPIELFYPITELIFGLTGLFLSYQLFSGLLTWYQLIHTIFILIIAGLLAVIDLKKFHIPDSLLFILLLFTFPLWVFNIININSIDFPALINMRGTGVILVLPFLALYLAWPKKMGFGDVKFIFVLGLALTIKESILMLEFSALLGILSVIILSMRTGKPMRKIKIPFVTYLVLGGLVSYPISKLILN